ncbi:MAG: discoidin domain-containing protein [Clostridiales Family XIII bacterium]|jgi:hypothetical protein|nr:discoidin domain-containing protein [Clostridiales Family XIII bacterium]
MSEIVSSNYCIKKKEETEAMICQYCRKEIEADSTFCPFCGKIVDPSAKQPAESTAAVTSIWGTDASDKKSAAAETSEQPQSGRKKTPVLIGVIVIVVVVVIVMIVLPKPVSQNAADGDSDGNATAETEIVPGDPKPAATEPATAEAADETAADEAVLPNDSEEVKADTPAGQTPPVFIEIYASSERAPMQGSGDVIDYSAGRAADGDWATAWCEGAPGIGIGEWLEMGASAPQRVSGIRILNGYFKSKELYDINNTISWIRIVTDRGTEGSWPLANAYNGFQEIVFEQPVDTQRIRFVIEDAEPQGDGEDTLVSEIEVF